MEAVRILQFGPVDLSGRYKICENCIWQYEPKLEEFKNQDFELVILSRMLTEKECEFVYERVQSYCIFYLEGTVLNEETRHLLECKKGSMMPNSKLNEFLKSQLKYFFKKPYGEKLRPFRLLPSPLFKGNVVYNGFTDLALEGDFGKSFSQAAFWNYHLPIEDHTIEFWLEYEKSGSVEIEIHATEFAHGSISSIIREWVFTEENLKDLFHIDNDKQGTVFISIFAKGKGKLRIIALHDRFSRKGWGNFLPGGERFVTKKGEEIFFYFDPGDLKPPLNVYFSGYKTKEGFEAYNVMRDFGAPFLLVSESRLEGGSFYIGDEEYEKLIADKIQDYLDELGFNNYQLVLSGLSMGTYGALYYGCDLKPCEIIVGKPLASLGSIAQRGKIDRPGEFETSLDILYKMCKSTGPDAIQKLDDHFWNKFNSTSWTKTKFAIAHQYEDDYDNTVYKRLLESLMYKDVTVISKGLHGRHNDNTAGVVEWFILQYKEMLRTGFGREID